MDWRARGGLTEHASGFELKRQHVKGPDQGRREGSDFFAAIDGNGRFLRRREQQSIRLVEVQPLLCQRLQERIACILVELDIKLRGHVIREVEELAPTGNR